MAPHDFEKDMSGFWKWQESFFKDLHSKSAEKEFTLSVQSGKGCVKFNEAEGNIKTIWSQ